MGNLFKNELHDEFGCWPLAYIPTGGADYGEVVAVGQAPETMSQELLDHAMEAIEASPQLRWSIVQRGFWVNGARDLRDFLVLLGEFTMAGRASGITCPTLFTVAANDPLGAGAQEFAERLSVPTTVLRFSAAEGAGDHCEMYNRSLLNTRALDWLDGVFANT